MKSESPEISLPESEKRRILLEEQYRNEARKQIEEITKKRSVWNFLNSSLGLWLLSAVFISGIGSCYTRHQDQVRSEAQAAESKRLEEQKIKELTQRLDLEISYRLSLAMSKLEAVHATSERTPDVRLAQEIRTAIFPLTSPMNDQTPSLFPEFKLYSGLALIAELRRHVPPEEQRRLKQILASLTGFFGEIEHPTGKLQRPKNVAGDIVATMKSQRWDNGFHYTDCDRERPFC